LKKASSHINRYLAGIILWVFTLAIMPWGLFHDHPPVSHAPEETNCTHKVHVSAQQENCLICKAHFEKNYTLAEIPALIFVENTPLKHQDFTCSQGYEALIATALRGPPLSA